jgi:hypothetical protein
MDIKKEYNKLYYQKNKSKLLEKSKNYYKVKSTLKNADNEKRKKAASDLLDFLFKCKHVEFGRLESKPELVLLHYKLATTIKNILSENVEKIYKKMMKDKDFDEFLSKKFAENERSSDNITDDLICKLFDKLNEEINVYFV